MTTIACNRKEMAADTRVSQEGIGMDAFSAVKLFRGKNGSIFGVTGENCEGSIHAMTWLQGNSRELDPPIPPDDAEWTIIELSEHGIALHNTILEREVSLEPMLAVGSGRKVAMYCMKYLNMTPAQAVREACKVDHFSNPPIYVCKLKDKAVHRWNGRAK